MSMIRSMAPKRFLVTGGQMYGNLGAAAMSIVTVTYIKRLFPNSEIHFISKYPVGERKNIERFFAKKAIVHIVPVTQVKATFLVLPLLLITSLFSLRTFSKRVSSVIKSFHECDYIVDIGGITYSEDRGVIGLIINATWTLLAILSKKPVIKLSQAFGPFNRKWFRLVSRLLLNRVKCLIARGELSRLELEKLGLRTPIRECADLAFLLQKEKPVRMTNDVKFERESVLIGIAPSSVLFKKLGRRLYLDMMVNTVEKLLIDHKAAKVSLYAHSYRQSKSFSNNDAPVCRIIYERLSDMARSRTELVVGDFTPDEMWILIARCDVFLACRFHAMISALSSAVPVAVLGWSHKYRETQSQFGIDFCIDYKKATVSSICGTLDYLLDNQKKIKEQLRDKLHRVMDSSARNFDTLAEMVIKKTDTENSSI
jgi:colanic acid/amylovoran biosynthesis protein